MLLMLAAALEASGTGALLRAFAFGADGWTRATYNAPSTSYTKVVQDGYNFLYSTDRGYGYSNVAALDGTVNNRGVFSGPDEIYDQFIGARGTGNSITFRVDLPNGSYRFVAAGGDASYIHSHTLRIFDGSTPNSVTLVEDVTTSARHFWTVGFDGKEPPAGDGSGNEPVFLAQTQSPVLEVTQGYIEVRQMVGSGAGDGGDLCLLEIWGLDLQPGPMVGVQDPAHYRVFQREGTTKSLSFAGGYAEHAPAEVQLRVLDHGSGSEVVPWTTVDASPAGGSFEGSLTVPQGGWYRLAVRTLDGSGTVLAESQGHNKWGVGVVILAAGQSNMAGCGDLAKGESYWPADDLVANYRIHKSGNTRLVGGSWEHLRDPYGDCKASMAPALGNALAAELGLPVAFVPTAVGGTKLHCNSGTNCWSYRNPADHADPSTLYGYSLARARAVGEVEWIIWHQGESDASDYADNPATSQAQYEADMQTLLTHYREDLGFDIPFFFAQLGTNSFPARTEATISAIRNAQHGFDSPSDKRFLSATGMDLPREDASHYTRDGYVTLGRRMAVGPLRHLGLLAYHRGPSILSARFVDGSRSQVDVTLVHRGGSDFSPATGITGFELVSGVTILVPNSAHRLNANTIRLELAATAPSGATLRYLYGGEPNISGMVKDDTQFALPLENTTEPVPIGDPVPVDHPPVFAAQNDTNIAEGQLLEWLVSASDPDGTVPSLAASIKPAGASFADNGDGSGVLSWTPDYEAAGAYSVRIEATSEGATATLDLTLTVQNVDRPPEFLPTEGRAVPVDESLELHAFASDPDGDAVVITLEATPALPPGADFDGSFLRLRPNFGDEGLYELLFIATAGGLSDSILVQLVVTLIAPPAPHGLSPAEGDTGVALQPLLSWATVGADSFRVQLSEDSLFSGLLLDSVIEAASELQLPRLAELTRHHWRVRATNGAGHSPWSTASFGTRAFQPGMGTVTFSGLGMNDEVWGFATSASPGRRLRTGPGSTPDLPEGRHHFLLRAPGKSARHHLIEVIAGKDTITVLDSLASAQAWMWNTPDVLQSGGQGIATQDYNGVLAEDWDGDGDVDLLLANLDGTLFYFRNDGTDLTPMPAPLGIPGPIEGLRALDVDRDGRPDLVLLGGGGALSLYRNRGNWSFALDTILLSLPGASGFHFLDADGDDRLDVILGTTEGYLILATNLGDGYAFDSLRLGDGSPLRVAGDAIPCVLDWNGDGREDLLVGAVDGSIRAFWSEPDGSWRAFGSLALGGMPPAMSGGLSVSVELRIGSDEPGLLIADATGAAYRSRARLRGDFDGDGVVSLVDFALFGNHWQTSEGDANWNASYNLVLDDQAPQTIDFMDFVWFGQSWEASP